MTTRLTRTVPAHRVTEMTQQIPTLNITFSLLYSTRDPFSTCKCLTVRTSSVPAALLVHYQGPSLTLGLPLYLTPRCLPSTILGPGLNLGLCTASTGAQSSQLLTRLFPSTRRVVLPGRPEIPDEPPNVMHRGRISEPTERVNKSTTVMQRQEGNFISSALGPKSHPAQWSPTRALNKEV